MNKFKIDLAQLLIFEFATYLDFDVRFWENQSVCKRGDFAGNFFVVYRCAVCEGAIRKNTVQQESTVVKVCEFCTAG